MRRGHVAVDLGASSARFAVGEMLDGRLDIRVVEQVRHEASLGASGRIEWDAALLSGICRRAVEFAAETFDEATVGIDTWGVDVGFLDDRGRLAGPLTAYRDDSHGRAMQAIEPHQARLYELTGIQKQPFNTLCQLIARRSEDPALPGSVRWSLLPDLFGSQLLPSGQTGHEATIASTTQMVGLDGRWCPEVFDLAGWPVPDSEPVAPGGILGQASSNVRVVQVGGHDTASAVCGLGSIGENDAFLNVGTWSILGCLLDEPIATPAARTANFTNERGVDGRIRFLANIPGFYVMNRLRDELGYSEPMADWISGADRSVAARLNLFAPELYNPASMPDAVAEQIGHRPDRGEEWAGIALASLADATAAQLRVLGEVTGRRFATIRAGGGGSASSAFCEAVADACGVPVVAGPSEATLAGNIGMQLLAAGEVSNFVQLGELMRQSAALKVYHPGQ